MPQSAKSSKNIQIPTFLVMIIMMVIVAARMAIPLNEQEFVAATVAIIMMSMPIMITSVSGACHYCAKKHDC